MKLVYLSPVALDEKYEYSEELYAMVERIMRDIETELRNRGINTYIAPNISDLNKRKSDAKKMYADIYCQLTYNDNLIGSDILISNNNGIHSIIFANEVKVRLHSCYCITSDNYTNNMIFGNKVDIKHQPPVPPILDNKKDRMVSINIDFPRNINMQKVSTPLSYAIHHFINKALLPEDFVYRVQVGASEDKEDVQKLIEELNSKGIEAFII